MGPVFVLTHNALEDEADPSIQFLPGGIRSAIGEARDDAGRKNVMTIGANIGRQCIQEGPIDEIRVQLAPSLPADGVRLFYQRHARRSGRGAMDNLCEVFSPALCSLKRFP
jgi:dihydrofolate reductase